MADDWSSIEVAATVHDYLAMLEKELRGEPFIKRDHNQRLQKLLNNRSRGAIEFKHQNISAVMIDLGFPYIDGYKPLANYQALLRDEVLAQLSANTALATITEHIVDAPATSIPKVGAVADVFVDPPVRDRVPAVYERSALPPLPTRINYLEREARNQSLGHAGELFALDAEHRRLWEAGERRLAERIEHVSQTRGNGLGYDIKSFDVDGGERHIEVKTTAFGARTPFFASAREVAVSAELPTFHLYRVFNFREAPHIFALAGSLRNHCILDPIEFRASLP
jgi:hypothetical protein